MAFLSYSFEDINAVAEKIDGWLLPVEAKLLYDVSSNLNGNGAIVEIGSWCSKSLTYLTGGALYSKNNCKIYSIDPFLTSKDEPNGQYHKFISNLKENGIFDKITHIKEKSQNCGKNFDEKIEFLFIDGFHKYEAVKADFDLFFPKIISGGFFAIHDISVYEGPTKLIKELSLNENIKLLNFSGITVLAQKVDKISQEDAIKNADIIKKIDEKIEKSNVKLKL